MYMTLSDALKITEDLQYQLELLEIELENTFDQVYEKLEPLSFPIETSKYSLNKNNINRLIWDCREETRKCTKQEWLAIKKEYTDKIEELENKKAEINREYFGDMADTFTDAVDLLGVVSVFIRNLYKNVS